MSDFDPVEREAEVNTLMDGAVEAAHEFLDAATGRDMPIVVGALWGRAVIREMARQFPEDGSFNDGLAQEVNEALAARGVPYRLTKGVA